MKAENMDNGNAGNPKGERLINIIWAMSVCAIILGALHFGRRIFIAERFIIPSSSMSPTLKSGDKVWVNKVLFGARIYRSLDFEDHAPLKCFRMPGIRKIRPGDVICFNYPYGYDDRSQIEFKINYVYCKRVVGTPGDTIGIRDGITWNNNYHGTIGVLENQLNIQSKTDFDLWRSFIMRTMPFDGPLWTIKEFGPLYIPRKGTAVELDSISRSIYGTIIQYETGSPLSDSMKTYSFKNNYYFAFGDNSISSDDSRYWGFIPEDFIIGIVAGKKVKNNPNQTY